MKKSLATVLFLLITVLSSSANAEMPEWTGVQTLTHASINPKITKDIGVRASVHCFWMPSTGTKFFFSYVGPTFLPFEWLWTSPQVGAVGNWGEDGSDALILSTWNNLSFAGGAWTLFLEADVYIGKKTDYFGYYSLDWHGPAEVLKLGAQAEQVNKNVTFGPHIGFKHGAMLEQIEYHVSVDKIHTVRFMTALSF